MNVKNEKSKFNKTVIESVVKDVKNMYWVKKRLAWVVLDIEEIRDNDNETGLKEGGGIEMSIYSAPFAMLAPSL